jgi:acyl-coenzyme A thioesterase PaaI-like protein
VTLDRHRVGWEGIAHGGIVTTLMDEVMAWTVLYFRESFTVTREIRARFRKPVPIESPLTVSGEIVDESRRFACKVRAAVTDADGQVLAEAEADFALLREEQIDLLPERVRADVGRFMAALREVKAAERRRARSG